MCGTCLVVLLTTALCADPCAPFGTAIITGHNCPSSTYPSIIGSDGTRYAATANVAYCASADNYLYTETRYPIDSATYVETNDTFEYTLWWDQPDTHCLLDLVSYIGSIFLRNSQSVDANGFINHPRVIFGSTNLLTGNCRISRSTHIASGTLGVLRYQTLEGKLNTARHFEKEICTDLQICSNPIAITVSCDTPDTSIGDKKIFFKGVKLLDSAGNVKQTLADETQPCSGIVGCSPICANGVCDLDQTCKCTQGWTDAACATAICTANCNSFGVQSCIGDTCLCRQGYSDVLCNTYCTGTTPLIGAECQTINDTSVWVYNNTLVVDTTTINVDVVVIGDLIVQSNLTLTDGAVITVRGCPVISGTLVLQLSPAEIEQLLATGQLTRTVLLYSAACTVNDFDSVQIVQQNDLKCVRVQQSPQKSPGQLSVLVTATQTDCKTDTPLSASVPNTTPSVPDWAIAIIVVVPVVATGIGVTVGLVKRQQQYDKEMARIGGG